MPLVADSGLVTRAMVRAAVTAYFQPPAIPGLNKVYSSYPRQSELSPPNYLTGQPVGTKSGGVGIVDIIRSRETRRAVGGPKSGVKRTEYEVALLLWMRSTYKSGLPAMADFDTLIDKTIAYMRTDRTLGTDGLKVWQAGELTLDVETVEPRLEPGFELLGAAVKFEVIQWNTT